MARNMNFPPELLSFLRKARRAAALTGAGVSQESGLSTFRDAQVGLWAQYRPEDLATPEAFARSPKLVWDWYALRREKARAAQPNPGHFALAEMEKRIAEFTLITQNVDGLHRRAGSVNVLELHGALERVKCSVCGEQAPGWDESDPGVPRCSWCGGLLRPDVVWFGESLPKKELDAAVRAVQTCDAFFSIGTSGLVQPAASLAHVARERGALVIEINTEPTPLTKRADFFLPGKSGEVLPALVEAIE